jgi:type IV secretion system protein VirD4
MGFAGDLAGEASGIIFRLAERLVAGLFSAFVRVSRPKKEDPRKAAARNTFAARNPPVNGALISAEPRGVFFGVRENYYVAKSENLDGHVLVVGGPGTGKSSCVAIPTLRSWKGAVFAVDIKGELYANTKWFRRSIKVFDPQDLKSRFVYDPYVFLKESRNIAQEARAIAQAIIPLPHNAKEPFWVENAQIILMGAILHYYDAGLSFIETLRKIKSYSPQALIKIVANSSYEKAQLCVKNFVELDGKVLAGIAAEINRGITTLVTDDDIICALTPDKNKEIISPLDLEYGHDIYIKIPEDLLRQWKPLLILLINQFITFFERRGENADNRPILFLLDEFPRLGNIPAMTDALATLRSKKVTICLIIQSLAQLKMIYGHDTQEVISDTCGFKAVLGATDVNTQEYFSKLVGTYEKIRNTESQNFDPYIGAPTGHGTQTTHDNEKRIIKPEEFATMRNIVLLYPLPKNFCRVQKQPYYLNPR